VVADDTTIDNSKVSDGSNDGVQQQQQATSLRVRKDVEEDGGVGGACWMIVECCIVGGRVPWRLYDNSHHHGWSVVYFI
jgi:hypothetical protein